MKIDLEYLKDFNFSKENIEKMIGFEINNFKVEPVFVNNQFRGLSVFVEPKKECVVIENNITILKSGKVNGDKETYIDICVCDQGHYGHSRCGLCGEVINNDEYIQCSHCGAKFTQKSRMSYS